MDMFLKCKYFRLYQHMKGQRHTTTAYIEKSIFCPLPFPCIMKRQQLHQLPWYANANLLE